MRRVSLCLGLLATACFKPGGGGESETDEGSTSAETGSATAPTSSISSPTSSDPTSDTMPATSSATMTTDEPTSTTEDPTGESSDSTGDIVCNDPEIACGGVCVDPMTDAAHCGACDHDCLGGDCTEGACQAVELATGKGRLFMVELVDDDIYYGGDGTDVGRIGKDGTNDEVIAPAGATTEDREWCYDSTNTGEEVLWGNDWVSAHWAVRGCVVPDCAGGPTQFIPGTTNVQALIFVPAEDRLFWEQDTEIRVMAWPGGVDNGFATGQTSVLAMGYDDQYLYWADRQATDDSDIRRQNLDGTGGVANMALGRPSFIDALGITENSIIWAENGDIVSAPLPNGLGGDEPDPIGTAGGSVRRLVVDDEHVYWGATGGVGTGSVQRCPLDGCAGAPEILADPIDRPWGIALDDVAVYWVTEGGSIWKIAK